MCAREPRVRHSAITYSVLLKRPPVERPARVEGLLLRSPLQRTGFCSRTPCCCSYYTCTCGARQVLQGLDALHRHGVVHLDVKPANIFVDDARMTACIGDFDISMDTRTRTQSIRRTTGEPPNNCHLALCDVCTWPLRVSPPVPGWVSSSHRIARCSVRRRTPGRHRGVHCAGGSMAAHPAIRVACSTRALWMVQQSRQSLCRGCTSFLRVLIQSTAVDMSCIDGSAAFHVLRLSTDETETSHSAQTCIPSELCCKRYRCLRVAACWPPHHMPSGPARLRGPSM